MAENKFHVVHQDFLTSGSELELHVGVLQDDVASRLGHAGEAVKIFDLRERNILVVTILFNLPADLRGGGRKDY